MIGGLNSNPNFKWVRRRGAAAFHSGEAWPCRPVSAPLGMCIGSRTLPRIRSRVPDRRELFDCECEWRRLLAPRCHYTRREDGLEEKTDLLPTSAGFVTRLFQCCRFTRVQGLRDSGRSPQCLRIPTCPGGRKARPWPGCDLRPAARTHGGPGRETGRGLSGTRA